MVIAAPRGAAMVNATTCQFGQLATKTEFLPASAWLIDDRVSAIRGPIFSGCSRTSGLYALTVEPDNGLLNGPPPLPKASLVINVP